jgi:hypothetical protein
VRTLPQPELASSHAALPWRMPTSSSPSAVSSTTEPRTTSPTRTLPLAVLTTTLVCAVDDDVAIGRGHPAVAGDLSIPGVTVAVLDHGCALDLADPYLAG